MATIPGLDNIFNCNPVTQTCVGGASRVTGGQTFGAAGPNGGRLGEFITNLGNVVFYIAGALLIIWLVWGVFQYIFAGGDKEKLAGARKRLTWAIVGFIIIVLAFSVSQFAQGLFRDAPGYSNFNKLTPVGP